MLKEISLGAGLAAIIGLIWVGVNLYPLIIVIGLYLLLTKAGDLKSNSKVFQDVKPTIKKTKQISFDDIGGQASAKKELVEALEFIINPKLIIKMGIRPLKGVLLAGPPGTGKTLLAKAAAFYTDSVFMAAAGSEFVEMYAGVGAQRVRNLFKQAKNMAHKKKKKSAILFIDELEILGGKRGTHGNHLEYDQTLNQLLVEMDGLQPNEDVNILVIGATNRLDMLDDAILRPGRFDRIVNVDLPDQEARLQILKLHTRNKPLHGDVDLKTVAKETFAFSGAHLESLTNEAAIIAFRDRKKLIEKKDFLEAIDKVMLGEKLDRRPEQKERKRIAVHEAGHALMSELLNSNSVSSLTIISRGKALGYMRQKPGNDYYLMTREFIEDQIAVLLSGSLSEELIIGNKSTGAAGDFHKAMELGKKIIDAGMSSLGVVKVDELPSTELYKELNQIICCQKERARKIIEGNKNNIAKITAKLLEEETVSGEYIRERLAMDNKELECKEGLIINN